MTTATEAAAEGDAARDAVLRAAREMFGDRGYAGTHIKAIAEAAGVSVSTLYARFGSKHNAYRASMGADPPVTTPEEPGLAGRAQRTREALLAAARECIERDGYGAARIGDIADRAGVAVGSFYTYFPSKLAVFSEVLRRALVAELADAHATGPDRDTDPAGHPPVRDQARRRIAAAVERYVRGYTRHELLVLRLEEAMGRHPELVPVRLELHRGYAERIAASLRHWRELGLVDVGLDPDHAGDALSAMVAQATRVWVTYGQPHDRDTAITTLTRLWSNAIGLDRPDLPEETP